MAPPDAAAPRRGAPTEAAAPRAARTALQVDRAGAVLGVALKPVEHLLVGEVAGLIGVLQLDPRLRPDPVLRLPDDIELPLLVGLADPCPQPGVVVLLVDLDLTLRRKEFLTRQAFEDERVGIGALDLLDRLGEEVGLEVGSLHDPGRHTVLSLFRL